MVFPRRGISFRIGANFWSRSIGRSRFGGRSWGAGRRRIYRRSISAYLAHRHLVNIGDRYHLRSPLCGRCIESGTRDLNGCAYKIIQPGPLELVSNVRGYVGQQIVPVTARMVLAENAMQRQLYT